VSGGARLRPAGLLLLAPLLALLLPAVTARAQAQEPAELFRRADALAAKGDYAAALGLYREWLLANGEAEAFARTLARAVDTASAAADALRLLSEFGPRVREPAAREALLERQAALLRLSGRVEEALVAQIGLPETPVRLVERAGLCLELGLNGEAEQILQRARESADAEAAASARVLLARVYLATDREAQAEAELRGLLSDQPSALAVPAALLALGEALRQRGDGAGAAEALAQLKSRFPASPEAALAEGSTGVRYSALPQRLLPQRLPPSAAQEAASPSAAPAPAVPAPAAASPEATATAPAASSPAAAAPPASPPLKALVQAGSFRDPENAGYLVRDLVAHGFAARVMEKPVEGIRYYRVVVGAEQSPESAQALILRLKDAGYEGFLLLE
jgi:tetratricopeptide (TPR) repeat protein